MTSRPRRQVPAAAVGLLVTAVVMGGLVLLSPGDEFATTRRLLGLGGDRYGQPPDFTPGEGSFAFLQTDRGSGVPIGYDPCTPLDYVVNPAGAPAGWEGLIADAVRATETASGLDLVDRGRTDRRPFDASAPGPVENRQSPVVIGFADAAELPDLVGDTAGLGGSLAVTDGFGHAEYVTGSVALDTAAFTARAVEDGRDFLVAIVTHELGHVLGLDHVDDPGELMAERPIRTVYGPGDLEGLARLGSLPCS